MYLRAALIAILSVMGIAAGASKMMEMPQEVAFFQQAGLSNFQLFLFGAVQVIGGVLVYFRSSRRAGAVMLLLTLAASAWFLFQQGKTSFALVSCLPVLIAAYLVYAPVARRPR